MKKNETFDSVGATAFKIEKNSFWFNFDHFSNIQRYSKKGKPYVFKICPGAYT